MSTAEWRLHKKKFSYTKLLLFNHLGGIVTMGLLLMFAPSSQYSTTSLRWNFDILPRQVWGAAFIVSALLLFFKPRAWTGAVFSTFILLWGMCQLTAVFTGHSQSLSGWIWPSLIGVNMLLWTYFARFDQ